MGAPQRLFVAAEIPGPQRELLAGWGRRAAQGDPALRALDAGALHLTLHFLGAREPAEMEPLGDVVQAAGARVGEPIPLETTSALWLAPRSPHVLTCAVSDPTRALSALYEGLRGPLELAAPGWRAEHRPLLPHVTVARVRRGTKPRIDGVPPAPQAAFAPVALTLMRSRLDRRGARYEALARAELPL